MRRFLAKRPFPLKLLRRPSLWPQLVPADRASLAPALFQATMNARPQRILSASSLTQSAPASPTNKGIHMQHAG